MPIKYKLIKERFIDIELGTYTTYGIAVYNSNSPIRKVSDVSTSKHRVLCLCRLYNKLMLDLSHLDDVIDDFLYT